MQNKIHLSSREVTEDNEYRNKNQKEDQEICWESPLEAEAGVLELRINIFNLCPFESDKIGLAGHLSLWGPCLL